MLENPNCRGYSAFFSEDITNTLLIIDTHDYPNIMGLSYGKNLLEVKYFKGSMRTKQTSRLAKISILSYL